MKTVTLFGLLFLLTVCLLGFGLAVLDCTPKQQAVAETAIDIIKVLCTREGTADACVVRLLRPDAGVQIVSATVADAAGD